MTFSVKLSNQATRFLRKLDKPIRDRIKKSLWKLKNPFEVVEHFEGNDYYKFRIGDYRALVDIEHNSKTVWIRVLDKRNRIYKK